MSRWENSDKKKKKVLLGKNILRRFFVQALPSQASFWAQKYTLEASALALQSAKSKVNQDWKELAEDSVYLIAERIWKVFEGKEEFARTEAVKQGAYESLNMAVI